MRKLEPQTPGGRRSSPKSAAAQPQEPAPARRLRRLQHEVERAARVQRSLLPDLSLPVGQFHVTAFYQPCACLGGDLYDLARRPDCAHLLVSDVMGHGLDSALITMMVKAAFQDAAADNCDPRRVLFQMNARLRRMLPDGMFIAATVARLDPRGGGIQLVNAGLPHPFVLHAADGRLEELALDGVPLGLFDADGPSTYERRRLTLAPGDVLLIASDGIGTIEREPGHCFEDDRLREVLAGLTGCGGHIADRLMAEALDFAGGRPLPDDIDIVTVSRCEPAGPTDRPARRTAEAAPDAHAS